jgi:glycosyltransferase involved in cell wall biosynthesis
MNICLLTRYFDFRGTGVSRIATEVLKRLECNGDYVQKISTDGHSLYSYFWYTAFQIPRRLPRSNVDVYHALATMEAMWLPRDKSIATFLDLFTTTDPTRAGAGMGYSRWKLEVGRRYFDLGSRLAKKCRYLVAISEKTKQEMIEYIGAPEKRIKVIPLGISDKLEPRIKKDNVFRIGTLGQLDKRKRIDLLITQFKYSKIDAELVIAGQGLGNSRQKLEWLAEGDKRIKFLGLVPDKELCEFYNSLDLFVFPTAAEGAGLPPIEAMACRRPVMVMSDAVIPEELKKRCIIVDNLTSVFDNVGELNRLTRKVDSDGNYKYAKEHSWDRCIDEYMKLYREIANK